MNIGKARWMTRRTMARAMEMIEISILRDLARPLIPGARYPA
jgi:hypothetical protein